MNGLNAISASNGWNIAFVGITIVFTGLTLLSLAISQIHKVLHLWETKDIYFQQIKEQLRAKEVRKKIADDQPLDADLPKSIKESAEQFSLLIRHLGEPFPLPKLLKLAVKRGVARPHATVNDLLQAKLIIPDKLGFFRWNDRIYNCISEKGDE